MKSFLAAALLLLPAMLNAQVRGDAASINFINYDHRGDQAFEFRTGIPPLKFAEKTMLIPTITLRQVNLSGDNVPPGEDLKLSDHGGSFLFVSPLGKWNFTGRFAVNFGNATAGLRVQRESTFYSGAAVATRPLGSSTTWKYSLGVIFLARGTGLPAVPAVALDYDSADQIYQFQLGFPTSQASYGFSQSLRVGFFAAFTSNSYLLPEASQLRTQGDYVGVKRIVAGTLVRVKLTNLIWLNTRLGYSVYGKTTILDGGLEERRRLDEESGVYLLVGLGIAIPKL